MILIFSAAVGVAAFIAELVFGRILKKGGKNAVFGASFIKTVLYPLAAASAALWGCRYIGREEDILTQLLICAGVSVVLFAVEFFLLKMRVSALWVVAVMVQSVLAVLISYYFGEKTDILKFAVAYGAAALLPAVANTAVYSLKTKMRGSKKGTVIYLLAGITAPVVACLAFAYVMSEVFINVPALQ